MPNNDERRRWSDAPAPFGTCGQCGEALPDSTSAGHYCLKPNSLRADAHRGPEQEPRCEKHSDMPAPVCGCIECFIALRSALIPTPAHPDLRVVVEKFAAIMQGYPIKYLTQEDRELVKQAHAALAALLAYRASQGMT